MMEVLVLILKAPLFSRLRHGMAFSLFEFICSLLCLDPALCADCPRSVIHPDFIPPPTLSFSVSAC